MGTHVGNSFVLIDRSSDRRLLGLRIRQCRFAFGLVSLFVMTVTVTLATLAFTAGLLPGWQSTAVASGSMAPAIRRGDVVVVRSVPIDGIGAGTIVMFDDLGTPIVHRVVGTDGEGSLTTKGDANRSADTMPVDAAGLRGVGVVLIPIVGFPRLWLMERDVARFLLVFVGITGSLLMSRWAWTDLDDPWVRSGRSQQASSWLNVALPSEPDWLVPPSTRRTILERSLQC